MEKIEYLCEDFFKCELYDEKKFELHEECITVFIDNCLCV